ncbi:MAG: hypothetical protein KGI71_05085 [Patescibacteria group bacterium]|nr:hypothetical protein [Patescibacteria group bacterium]
MAKFKLKRRCLRRLRSGKCKRWAKPSKAQVKKLLSLKKRRRKKKAGPRYVAKRNSRRPSRRAGAYIPPPPQPGDSRLFADEYQTYKICEDGKGHWITDGFECGGCISPRARGWFYPETLAKHDADPKCKRWVP